LVLALSKRILLTVVPISEKSKSWLDIVVVEVVELKHVTA